MALQTRSSVLAIKPESTEGTPVAPTGASDFVELQDDFSMEPAFNELTSAELKASIGVAKSVMGLEAPTASFSHYLRHSGVEGQAPNYKEVLEGLFGTETVKSTQYDTVSSSTVNLVKVDTGEGAQFQRGQALLVKNSAGYEIRPVHSVSSDDLSVGFSLVNAPGSGVNLGKAVIYSPANSGHQSLSIWHYVANGGATQMMAGAKVTEGSFSFAAGEMINASFSLEGTGYYFNPIEITASSKYIDFTDDNGTFAATVTVDMYKTPKDLASAIQTALNTADPLETFTCVYSNSTGKFTIATSTSTLLSLLWNTGTNTANSIKTKIGFSNTDDTSATTYTSDTAVSFAAPYTPSYDAADPLVAKDNRFMIGDQTDFACFAASNVECTISNSRAAINSICSTSGVSGSVISSREVTLTVSALLNQYDVDKFYRMKEGTETRACYVFGQKSGGNWVAGKCGCLYMPTCTVTSVNITDQDGLVALELELKGFVDSSGNGEVYLSFV